MPGGFESLASSVPCPVAAAADSGRKFYGLQFHPEVQHTAHGIEILRNFVTKIAGCPDNWKPGDIAEEKVRARAEPVGPDGEVVRGPPGRVDSGCS